MAKRKRGGAAVAQPVNSWRNRIVGYGEESPEQLLANPKNWRIHPQPQQDALGAVLDTVGWVSVACIVNKHTGFVVDGHLRVSLAISRGEQSIPVAYVDLTDEEETLVLASFDPISAAAVTDGEKLNELLAEVTISNEDLDNLFSTLLEEGQKTTLQDVTGDGSDGGDMGSQDRALGDKKSQIKPVLYADEIAVFEHSLRATGERNRGKALMQVCQFYLDARSEEARQLDTATKSLLAG